MRFIDDAVNAFSSLYRTYKAYKDPVVPPAFQEGNQRELHMPVVKEEVARSRARRIKNNHNF